MGYDGDGSGCGGDRSDAGLGRLRPGGPGQPGSNIEDLEPTIQ